MWRTKQKHATNAPPDVGTTGQRKRMLAPCSQCPTSRLTDQNPRREHPPRSQNQNRRHGWLRGGLPVPEHVSLETDHHHQNHHLQAWMLGCSLARSPVAKDGPLEGDHHLHRLHLEQPGVVRAQQDVQRRSARRHLRQGKKKRVRENGRNGTVNTTIRGSQDRRFIKVVSERIGGGAGRQEWNRGTYTR